MWKNVSAIIGAVVLLGTVIGGWVWFDATYAKAGDVRANQMDIRINGLKDDIRWYQDQQSYIMNRCGTKDPSKLPDYAVDQFRSYDLKKQELERQLDVLQQQRAREK